MTPEDLKNMSHYDITVAIDNIYDTIRAIEAYKPTFDLVKYERSSKTIVELNNQIILMETFL